MQRTDTRGMHAGTTRGVKDVETWLANSLATILAGLAIASGVIGLLVAFGYINGDNSVNHFNDGMVWLVMGLVLGLGANVFRREHHIVGPDETRSSGSYDVGTTSTPGSRAH